jgi:hypothetical protein
MKYFETKKDSLEEVISKAINEDNRPSAKDLLEAGGKYLKYSDLLLQKGRLMAKNQSTAMIDKEIKKEMQKLGIKEATGDKEKYQKFFQSALKKFGVDSPADLDGEKKKEFFNYVDKNYKGDHEEEVDLEEQDIKIVLDNVPDKDFDKFVKKNKLKTRYDFPGASKVAGVNSDEIEVSGDKRAIEKLLKLRNNDSLKNYKLNSRTKTYTSESDLKEYIQADGTRRKVKEGDQRRKENKLNEKDLDKNVNETLDRIREVNVEKGRTMRSILADIWNMNEGKSPFDKVKKEEDEEVEKSSKTATGQKPTKVEIEPEVK